MNSVTGSKKYILALQHVLAMFGATVLVPALTGLDPSIALLCAGIGTIVFHLCTKGQVPVFLGSSFAFIGAISMTLSQNGIAAVKGGIIVAGLVYVAFAGLVYLVGVDRVRSFFPPIVTGPVIMVIGLRLSPVALSMAGYSVVDGVGVVEWKSMLVAVIVVAAMIVTSVFIKGFFKLVPILISIFVGYIASLLLGLVDFTPLTQAAWLGLSKEAFSDLTTIPSFGLTGIIAIAPIAIVTFIEHIGDITTNGAVVGKDFYKEPGLHRTLLGDGLATALAGLLGGPANTTYSENTGVLAVTKVYDPSILRIAAVFAVVLGLVGKFGGFVQSIPAAVMGGVSIILFGMISSIGVRTMVDAKLDFGHSRNLMISSLVLVTGIAINEIQIAGSFSISGLAIAAILGIVINKILPQNI